MKKLIIPSLLALLPVLANAQPPAGRPSSMSEAFMMQLDANRDGKVSKAEFLANEENQFDKMDSNKDGDIDRTEIEAMEKRMREQMQKMRKHPTGNQ